MCLVISGLTQQLELTKPFNPILGETYEARIGNCGYASEQISHHPPITGMLLENENSRTYGNFDFFASTSPNSVAAGQRSPVYVELKDEYNSRYEMIFPEMKIEGLMFGKRTVHYSGICTVVDLTHKIYACMKLNPDKKGFFKSMFTSQASRTDYFQ